MSTKANWKQNPVIRFFSSIRTGACLIALILVYACVASAVPPLRGALEMTEMQAFGHWLFAALILLLCTSVIIATLARIRFSLVNAGVLTVHTGLLILCGGAIWYFSTKVEGDVQLRSPRIDLVSTSGQQRSVASLLPERGKSWSAVMPAFGGRVSLQVADALLGGDGMVQRATVLAQMGDKPPVSIELVANDQMQKLGDKLALQLSTFEPERKFYDRENVALYFRQLAGATSLPAWQSAEIPGLPLFRERYLNEGYELVDTSGRVVRSNRTSPEADLGLVKIPTGWFEPWRMPIRLEPRDLPFDVEITGFVPYIAGFQAEPVSGGAESNPAIKVHLALPGTRQAVDHSLFAGIPSESLFADARTPIEFRWVSSDAERNELFTPLAGGNELLIEIKDPPLQKRIAIQKGQTIDIEGTPYHLTVQDLYPAWPLMSPGFERASSPAALVAVDRGDKKYTRTVIQRYPQLSQDIDETGMRRKEGPYDPNLVLRYRTAQDGWVTIVADSASVLRGQCELGIFDTLGQVERRVTSVGQTQRLNLSTLPLELTVAKLLEKARRVELPVIEPVEGRQANISPRGASAIRMKFMGRGALAGWSDEQWCSFSNYPDDNVRSIFVQPPGSNQTWEIAYSRVEHDLGGELTPGKLTVKFFPGRRSAESWRSDFLAKLDNSSTAVPAAVYTNQTSQFGKWTLFQSGAAQDHWSYTVVGVGNRNGVTPMVAGCIMIPLGCLFAFYVKPILKKRRMHEAIAQAEARGIAVKKKRPMQPAAVAIKAGS